MSNCKCQNGGGTTCGSDEMAICREINGNCEGSCIRIPSGLSGDALNVWAFDQITRGKIFLKGNTKAIARRVIDQGYHEQAVNGKRERVTFHIPRRNIS